LAQDAIICDIDGVLADVRHRLPLIHTQPAQWNSFFDLIPRDPLIEPMQRLLIALSTSLTIILVTGRPKKTEQATLDWLRDKRVPFDLLYMRNDGDSRHERIIKEEAVAAIRSRNITPIIAFEDSPAVVKAYQELGILSFETWRTKPPRRVPV